MRLNLATKFSAIIVGVVVLALVSSALALLSTWQVGRLMQHTVDQNLPSIQVTGELQMLLCEPRGFLASYILEGGNRVWVDELRDKQRAFDEKLTRARRLVQTREERESLVKLESAYRVYDAKREKVIALYDKGDIEEAKRVLLEDVNDLYKQAYDQSQAFMMANADHVASQTADAQSTTRRATWLVGILAISTIVLGAGLLGLFFRGVLFPLRRMVADAQDFAGGATLNVGNGQRDELRAVGDYLRTLMSDVVDTRSTLEQSRSQLTEAEKKLASVGKLAASVAHEIRNPLGSIRLCVSYIQMKFGNDAGLDQEFGIVSEEFNRLDGILKSFLEFSRPPALKLQPHCIRSLLDKTLALVSHQMAAKNLRLAREDAVGLPQIMADPEQLKQVVLNVVKNAAEAASEGSEVRVSTELDDVGQGSMVVLRVHNTGPAIPEDVRQRIFEPFFTTKKEGTGLGLCICARIMAAHGGRLVLESSTDQGTVFALQIPIARTEKEHDQVPQARCA